MKFLLTSAGVVNSSIEKALLELVGKPANEMSVVFVPTAAGMVADDKRWLVENYNDFLRLGLKSFDIVDIAALPKQNWQARFAAADVICFGGGDEQYLVKVMRESGVAEALSELLQSKVYVGISAGSMVAGKLLSQDLVRRLMPEEAFEGADPGLGILNFSILPHLNSDYFAHLRADLIRSLTSRFPATVYALDDASALKIVGDQVEVVTEGEFVEISKD
jgi:dipeptidase E